MTPPTLIQLTAAQASYQGTIALDDINLSVHQGEKLALVGRSGAGKSTLLSLIYEHHPDGTALVPQDNGLVHKLSVYHNVYMGQLGSHPGWYNLVNLIRPIKDRVAEVDAVLQRLQLDQKLFEPVGKLSGGQRQRTAVARSLYQGGQLLLADEPVSAVDDHQSRLVLDALCSDFSTVVLAMHDVNLALEYCDRIIGVEDGRIVLDQPSNKLKPEELLPLYRGEALAAAL